MALTAALLTAAPSPGASNPLNKRALNRSRKALGSFLFMCLAARARLAFLHQRDFVLLAASKRYFMLKFNGELLTSRRNRTYQSMGCSDRLNFASFCGGSGPPLAVTSWHILTRPDANTATPYPHQGPRALPGGAGACSSAFRAGFQDPD